MDFTDLVPALKKVHFIITHKTAPQTVVLKLSSVEIWRRVQRALNIRGKECEETQFEVDPALSDWFFHQLSLAIPDMVVYTRTN